MILIVFFYIKFPTKSSMPTCAPNFQNWHKDNKLVWFPIMRETLIVSTIVQGYLM